MFTRWLAKVGTQYYCVTAMCRKTMHESTDVIPKQQNSRSPATSSNMGNNYRTQLPGSQEQTIRHLRRPEPLAACHTGKRRSDALWLPRIQSRRYRAVLKRQNVTRSRGHPKTLVIVYLDVRRAHQLHALHDAWNLADVARFRVLHDHQPIARAFHGPTAQRPAGHDPPPVYTTAIAGWNVNNGELGAVLTLGTCVKWS